MIIWNPNYDLNLSFWGDRYTKVRPSPRSSLHTSVSRVFQANVTCFEISIWNLMYISGRCDGVSIFNFIGIPIHRRTLQPTVDQTFPFMIFMDRQPHIAEHLTDRIFAWRIKYNETFRLTYLWIIYVVFKQFTTLCLYWFVCTLHHTSSFWRLNIKHCTNKMLVGHILLSMYMSEICEHLALWILSALQQESKVSH